MLGFAVCTEAGKNIVNQPLELNRLNLSDRFLTAERRFLRSLCPEPVKLCKFYSKNLCCHRAPIALTLAACAHFSTVGIARHKRIRLQGSRIFFLLPTPKLELGALMSADQPFNSTRCQFWGCPWGCFLSSAGRSGNSRGRSARS